MALRYYRNGPATALNGGIDGSQTTLDVEDASGFPANFPYTIIVDYGNSDEEVMDVTDASGDTLTVDRGVDSTTALPHDTEAPVVHGVSARDHREANSHVNASGDVHGLTGEVVGTTDSQTLENKTFAAGSVLDSATITDSDIENGTVTGTVLRDEVVLQADSSSDLDPLIFKDSSGTEVGYVGRSGQVQSTAIRGIGVGDDRVRLRGRATADQTRPVLLAETDGTSALLEVRPSGRTGIGKSPESGEHVVIQARDDDDNALLIRKRSADASGRLLEIRDENDGELFYINQNGFLRTEKIRVDSPGDIQPGVGNPGFQLGGLGADDANLVMDVNEIQARIGSDSTASLNINNEGGNVNINRHDGNTGDVRVPGDGRFEIGPHALTIGGTEPSNKAGGDIWINTDGGSDGGVWVWRASQGEWVKLA